MRVRGLALFALGMFALLATPAWAQTSPASALREWGLLGWWSSRCDLPPGDSNSYYGFAIAANGRAYLERKFGNPRQNDRSEVLSAELRADGTLALTIDFTSFGQVRLNVYAKSNGRTRVIYNSRPGGTDVTVEDGVLRHNGRPTPWAQKCR